MKLDPSEIQTTLYIIFNLTTIDTHHGFIKTWVNEMNILNIPALEHVHALTGSVSSSTLALYVMGLQSRVLPTSVHGKNMGPRSSPSSTSTVSVVVAVRRSLG